MNPKLKKLAEGGFAIVGWVQVLLITAMVLVVLYQVLARFFIKDTPAWTGELAQLLTLWFGFLGSAYLIREKGHIALEFLVSRLSEKIQRQIINLVNLFIFGFCLYLLVYGFWLVILTMRQTLPGSGIPVGISYLPIPVCGGLGILALLFPKALKEEKKC